MRHIVVTFAGAWACVPVAAGAPAVRGPVAVHVVPEDGTLLVVCEKSGTVARVDGETGEVLREAAVGAEPFDLAWHPDGQRVYVSVRRGQFVAELDAETLGTLRRFPLRGDPTGVAVSRDGRWLYAGVHTLDQVAVFDLESGAERKRLVAGNGPEFIRPDPVRGLLYVSNLLSTRVVADRPPVNEVTVIDEGLGRVVARLHLANANVGRGIAFTPDGSLGLVTLVRPKNLVPMVQVARGWVQTNGFAVVLPQGEAGEAETVQLLIDEPNRAWADPYDVVCTPDGEQFYISCAGGDSVVAISTKRLREVVQEVQAGRVSRYADHLGLSRRYVTARLGVGANPRGLAVSEDGRWVYVANRLDDSITVIDTSGPRVARTVRLAGGAPAGETGEAVETLALGERLFHSAARTFQKQFSCASCHPDNGFDGLQYDLEPDGLGRNIVDNRDLRGLTGTEPFKWTGKNPDVATQCGVRTAKWIVRTGWLGAREVVALSEYIHSLQPAHNPHGPVDGALTPAQRRGKAVFERTVTNDGRMIAERDRCDFCHRPPLFTNHERFDVGTAAPTDTTGLFDTPHLRNVFESGPYLHDGRAATLEEIWTKYNPEDRHGISSDWTKQQLNDLVEYLKSL